MPIDYSRYAGYLSPMVPVIVEEFQAGHTPLQIAEALRTLGKQSPWGGRPDKAMITRILRQVGAMPAPKRAPAGALSSRIRHKLWTYNSGELGTYSVGATMGYPDDEWSPDPVKVAALGAKRIGKIENIGALGLKEIKAWLEAQNSPFRTHCPHCGQVIANEPTASGPKRDFLWI